MPAAPQQRTKGYDFEDLQNIRALSFLSYASGLQATSTPYDPENPDPAHASNLAELRRIIDEEPVGIIDGDDDTKRDDLATKMYKRPVGNYY